jgi:helix-turn-helix protein
MRAGSQPQCRWMAVGNKARSRCYGSRCYTGRMPRATDQSRVMLDSYVLDTLMHDLIGHDRSAAAFVVYLHLWRHSIAVDRDDVRTSLRTIAEGTGLSKRGVQDALNVLGRRQLIGISRQSITDVPVYTVKRPWLR